MVGLITTPCAFLRWAGQLGTTNAVPVIYVPELMITHMVGFYVLLHLYPNRSYEFAGIAAPFQIRLPE